VKASDKFVGKIWERILVSGNQAKSHRINGPYVLFYTIIAYR